jgi:poly-gamma-glutamate synthesis protein (capsule biosynthesis protein)
MLAQAASAVSPPAAAQLQHQFIFVAAGDMLGPYKSNLRLDDPSFAKVVSIVKGADAAFANEEGSTFDLATFTGWASASRTNIVPPHSLATARAFKEMGFDLLSRANNHSTDWGIEGMLASDRALDAIGIVHAGTGRSLEAARAPAYFQSAKGRVALIASASTFPPDAPAGDPSRGAGPRPGLNPLRVQLVNLITPEKWPRCEGLPIRKRLPVSLANKTFPLANTPPIASLIDAGSPTT